MLKKQRIQKISKNNIRRLKFKYEILEENEKTLKICYIEYTEASYESLIVNAIRKRYSIDEELAILRQRDVKPEEFLDYNSYVEECKANAKSFVEEREAARLPKPVKESEEKNKETENEEPCQETLE